MTIEAVLAGEARWCVENADSVDALVAIPDCSVHAIVCDPPAGISFMGKNWDSDKGGRDQWIAWLRGIMTECLRVLKPGGHALIWAIPRTSHWTGTAAELAGFEIRDVVTHLFGSGFPKSLNVASEIEKRSRGASRGHADPLSPSHNAWIPASMRRDADASILKQGGNLARIDTTGLPWDGWGTALKPACEFWFLARKPLEGTVARNVLEHGTGGINVDGCRIGDEPIQQHGRSKDDFGFASPEPAGREWSGRWPANVALSHTDECEPSPDDPPLYWCAPDCPVAMLDAQSGNRPGMSGGGKHKPDATPGMFGAIDCTHTARGDQGGASRFFANFKADEDEWARQDRSQHDQTDVTSPQRAISGDGTAAGFECSMMSSGSNITGPSLPDIKSTTKTKTSKTTASKTSTCSTPRPTSDSTLDAKSGTEHGGNRAASAANSSQSMPNTGTSASKAGPYMAAVDPATLGLYANPSGAARIGYFPKTSTREREAGCDALPLKSAAELVDREADSPGMNSPRAGAGRTSGGRRNSHPTCKSIALMRWLVRLITPPGGLVLDPFCESGSTGCAAVQEGARFIGIELDPEYTEIARARIAHWEPKEPEQPQLFAV